MNVKLLQATRLFIPSQWDEPWAGMLDNLTDAEMVGSREYATLVCDYIDYFIEKETVPV